MTPNDKLPETTQERIKADALTRYPPRMSSPRFMVEVDMNEGRRLSYIAGATAENAHNESIRLQLEAQDANVEILLSQKNDLQTQAQRMADALDKISNIVSWMEETGASRISEIAETALKQWNLGEVEKKDQLIPTAIYKQQGSKTDANQFKDGKKEEDDPCPHCGKELFRDRNLCCRACGKEVEI